VACFDLEDEDLIYFVAFGLYLQLFTERGGYFGSSSSCATTIRKSWGFDVTVAAEAHETLQTIEIISDNSLMRSRFFKSVVPFRVCCWEGMAVTFDMFDEFCWRVFFSNEKYCVAYHFYVKSEDRGNRSGESQEIFEGIRACHDVDGSQDRRLTVVWAGRGRLAQWDMLGSELRLSL